MGSPDIQLCPEISDMRSFCTNQRTAKSYSASVTAPSLAELTSRAYFASTPLRA